MSIDIVERYLKAQIAESKAAAAAHAGPRRHPFVTISRQCGAGGTTLATHLLEVFSAQPDKDLFGGWQVFDRRLCEIVAKDPTYTRSMDALIAEEYPTRTHDFFRQVIGSTIDHGILMDRVFEVVRALAAIGKAIIVGRGGSEVTRDMPQGLSLRLVAPLDDRVHHLTRLEDLSERKAKAEVARRDQHRARLLSVHFGVDIEDPTRYDITWNTSRCTHDDIADSVVAMLRLRSARNTGVAGRTVS